MNPIVTNNDELSYEQVNALIRKIVMDDDIRLKEVDFFDVSQVEIFAEEAVKLEYFSSECSNRIPVHVQWTVECFWHLLDSI